MTNEERWEVFIKELRAYVEEHHHFPNKHTSLLNAIKYTRKKINEGTLEDWKREMFEEIAAMRDLTIHTGGLKKNPSTGSGTIDSTQSTELLLDF